MYATCDSRVHFAYQCGRWIDEKTVGHACQTRIMRMVRDFEMIVMLRAVQTCNFIRINPKLRFIVYLRRTKLDGRII